MLRLNISHALPQTDIRTRRTTVDDSHMVPAQIHTNDEQARSNKGVTQVRIDINSYPSRRAYGARNMTDFTRENGQRGISDVQSATSRHTQKAWSVIENGAKRGNFTHQQAQQEVFAKAKRTRYIEARHIPDPQIVVAEPAQVVGEPDQGDVTAEISTTPSASIRITTGSAETYIKDQGFIRRWVTEDKYDMYV